MSSGPLSVGVCACISSSFELNDIEGCGRSLRRCNLGNTFPKI